MMSASARQRTCQLFETGFIERFSRIHPATPFVFWVPVIAWRVWVAARAGVTAPAIVGLALAGAFVWTLAEYSLHRWVFHWTGPRPFQQRLHFIVHGVHHDFPDDAQRLVMPLGLSVPIGAAFYLLFRPLLGPALVDAFFAGFVLGYLAYDGTHWAVHHRTMKSRIGKWLKRYHMIHHHVGSRARWGVSSPLWDWVFGTMEPS